LLFQAPGTHIHPGWRKRGGKEERESEGSFSSAVVIPYGIRGTKGKARRPVLLRKLTAA